MIESICSDIIKSIKLSKSNKKTLQAFGLKGCTQFSWPLSALPYFRYRRVMANRQGRSSGSPALLATFPSRSVETVA